MQPVRVLVVDDDDGVRAAWDAALAGLDQVQVVAEADPDRARRRLREERFDLLFTELRPPLDGLQLLKAAHARDPGLPVVVMTSAPTVGTAVECLRLGAVDYLAKPLAPESLRSVARRLLPGREATAPAATPDGPVRCGEMLGSSPPMRQVFDLIERVAATDVDVLILGETGTGKELVARALHRQSKRGEHRFVPIDCGAIPDGLLENELFGHERGAFTGAGAASIGLLELADQGTFFMDEVGELPHLLQAKLLRALQERKVRRVGGKNELPIDVRVIAATGRDLSQEVEQGRFRRDLFYRINVVTIHVPPLRERGDDVRLLAEAFLRAYGAEMGKPVVGFTPEALDVLLCHPWPGNVRQLQNVVRRGIAMCRGERVGVSELPESLLRGADALAPLPSAGAETRLDGEEESGSFFQIRARRMAAFERQYLSSLLESHRGDVVAAAKEAGVPRGTYYRLLKNHHIKAAAFRS